MESLVVRILGPYRMAGRHSDRWRVIFGRTDGERWSRTFDTQAEADAFALAVRKRVEERVVREALGHADRLTAEAAYRRPGDPEA